ncbi:MAG: hypothetical protein ACT4R6_02950 [Gemmatimonadaceae bacterium]
MRGERNGGRKWSDGRALGTLRHAPAARRRALGITRRALFPAAWSLLACAAAQTAAAQDAGRMRYEVRGDAVFAKATLLQAGAGAAFRLGYNVRAHAAALAGTALRDAKTRTSARGDFTLRLLLDPFGETRLGPYAGGGIGVLYDGFEKTRPVAVFVLGVEGPLGRGPSWALETGLGGGVRIALIARQRAARYR